MNNRIVVYLKSPPAKGKPSKINILTAVGGQKVVEADFASGMREIDPGKKVTFTISADTGVGTVDWLAIGWKPECRASLACLLGERGNKTSDSLGIDYKPTVAPPCRELTCTFDGDGQLVCKDDVGVTVAMDLTFDRTNALCLTVSTDALGSADVAFPGNEFATASIP